MVLFANHVLIGGLPRRRSSRPARPRGQRLRVRVDVSGWPGLILGAAAATSAAHPRAGQACSSRASRPADEAGRHARPERSRSTPPAPAKAAESVFKGGLPRRCPSTATARWRPTSTGSRRTCAGIRRRTPNASSGRRWPRASAAPTPSSPRPPRWPRRRWGQVEIDMLAGTQQELDMTCLPRVPAFGERCRGAACPDETHQPPHLHRVHAAAFRHRRDRSARARAPAAWLRAWSRACDRRRPQLRRAARRARLRRGGWSGWDRSSSSSARYFPRDGTCCRPTSPTSSRCWIRKDPGALPFDGIAARTLVEEGLLKELKRKLRGRVRDLRHHARRQRTRPSPRCISPRSRAAATWR